MASFSVLMILTLLAKEGSSSAFLFIVGSNSLFRFATASITEFAVPSLDCRKVRGALEAQMPISMADQLLAPRIIKPFYKIGLVQSHVRRCDGFDGTKQE